MIKVNDDHAAVLVGIRRHDGGNDLAQEIVALPDLCGIPSQPLVAAGESRVHIIELVWGYPVVISYGVIRQVDLQLLQWGIVWGQRIGGNRIVAAVGVREEHHGIVLGSMVELVGAVVLIDVAVGKHSRETLQWTVHCSCGRGTLVNWPPSGVRSMSS